MRSLVLVGDESQSTHVIFNWNTGGAEPPVAIKSMCSSPTSTEKLTALYRLGQIAEAKKYKPKECQLSFSIGSAADIGLQTHLGNDKVRFKYLVPGEKVSKKQFVEGVNWILDQINSGRSGFSPTTKILFYKTHVPTVLRHALSIEDVFEDEVGDNGTK